MKEGWRAKKNVNDIIWQRSNIIVLNVITGMKGKEGSELNESVCQFSRKISIIDFSSFVFINPNDFCHYSLLNGDEKNYCCIKGWTIRKF